MGVTWHCHHPGPGLVCGSQGCPGCLLQVQHRRPPARWSQGPTNLRCQLGAAYAHGVCQCQWYQEVQGAPGHCRQSPACAPQLVLRDWRGLAGSQHQGHWPVTAQGTGLPLPLSCCCEHAPLACAQICGVEGPELPWQQPSPGAAQPVVWAVPRQVSSAQCGTTVHQQHVRRSRGRWPLCAGCNRERLARLQGWLACPCCRAVGKAPTWHGGQRACWSVR